MVMWKYDLQEIRLLPMLKEIWNVIHMKMFRSQIIAVHDFYSIYKATIFNAEQIILGIEASRLVESDSISTCRN